MDVSIFDFQLVLPPDANVERVVSGPEGVVIDIGGGQVDALVAATVEQTAAAGFTESTREEGRVVMERGEQRLLLVYGIERATVQTWDPTGLPHARFEDSAVLLGDMRFDCGTELILPLRELYLEEHHLRSGAWRLSGASAEDVMRRVMESAVAGTGLRRGAVFGPAKGGMPAWSGEAYSMAVFVKFRVVAESAGVLLQIDLVDKSGADLGSGSTGSKIRGR